MSHKKNALGLNALMSMSTSKVTVNLEIFRVLFHETWHNANFRKIKPSQHGEITLSFTVI